MPETGRQDIEERQDKQDWRKHGWLDNFTFHLVDTPNWRIEPFQVCEDLMEYLYKGKCATPLSPPQRADRTDGTDI